MDVIPDRQKQGVGSKLVEEGLKILSKNNINIVFVLGDPKYYSRFGFKPAIPEGFNPSNKVPEEWYDAWMYISLKDFSITNKPVKVSCAKSLDDPKMWRD